MSDRQEKQREGGIHAINIKIQLDLVLSALELDPEKAAVCNMSENRTQTNC